MKSKRSLEGYLWINNGDGPALSEEAAAATGKDVLVSRQRGALEASVLTCSHCQAQMIVNPLRTRDRPYCRKCDHYLCDGCAAAAHANGGDCKPLSMVFDIAQERAIQKGTANGPLGI